MQELPCQKKLAIAEKVIFFPGKPREREVEESVVFFIGAGKKGDWSCYYPSIEAAAKAIYSWAGT